MEHPLSNRTRFTAATPGLGHDRPDRDRRWQEIDQYLSRAGITVHVEMEFDNADPRFERFG